MRLLELGPNQIRRFYRGGPRIAAFRDLPPAADDAPEDWIASTTAVFGEPDLGRSHLDDGTLLADAFAADPEAFFEPAHLAAFGAEPAVLLKLLDAGERLALHFHPDDAFAAAYLGSAHGKTEAWCIVDAEPGAVVHLGFSSDLAAAALAEAVDTQDISSLLDAAQRLPVGPGDTIFVPAGVPHAIGAGILLLELQQPADLSLLLEWQGVTTERDALLGLPRELVLRAVDRSATDVARFTSRRGSRLFPPEADRFFRASIVAGGDELEPAFSVLIATDGEGELRPADGEPVRVRRGSVVLVPFGSGAVRVRGDCRAVRCRPPLPAA